MNKITDLIIYEGGKISKSEDIFKNIKEININYEQENFLVFCLNTKNKVLSSKVLFMGGLNACLIDPKTIFREALLNNSAKIIIAHNHPSNDLTPSYEDRDIFKKVAEAGEILDIKVLDSIIFNKEDFYSIIEEGDFK